MHERDKKESVGTVAGMETSLRGDLWQKDGSMSEGLQNGSEICCDVCFGDGGTDKKDRRPSWRVDQSDGAGWAVWRES